MSKRPKLQWESDLPPRPSSVVAQTSNKHLPEGYTLTDKWGDDWILTDGKFVVDGWYIKPPRSE